MHPGVRKLIGIVVALAVLTGGIWLGEIARDHRGSDLGPILLVGSLLLMIGGLLLAIWQAFRGREVIMDFVRRNNWARKLMALLSTGLGLGGVIVGGYIFSKGGASGIPRKGIALLVAGGVFLIWWAWKLLMTRPLADAAPDRGGSNEKRSAQVD